MTWWKWADGAFQTFNTEVIGAILAFGLINVLVGGREKRQADEEQHQRDQLAELGLLNVQLISH